MEPCRLLFPMARTFRIMLQVPWSYPRTRPSGWKEYGCTMTDSFVESTVSWRCAFGLLLVIGVAVLGTDPVGAMPVSQTVSARPLALTPEPLENPTVSDSRRAAEEGPDSTRTATTAVADPQCTVKFQYDSHGIDEALTLTVLHLVHNCADESNAYIVLGSRPFGGAKKGVDYSVSSRRIYLDDLDGTGSWGFRIVDDDIFDPGEGAYVFFDTLSSGVTVSGPDSTRVDIKDNDDPTNTVPGSPQSLYGTPGNRRVTLSWLPPSSDGGSAIGRYEYRYAVETETFPTSWRTVSGGADARTVTVSSLNNGTTYKFQVRAVNGIGEGSSSQTSATPSAGGSTSSMRINDITVGEAAGTARLTVTLSPGTSQVVTVGWATVNGSAQSGSDYTSRSGNVTFPPNTTTQQVTVPITDDEDVENTEIFTVVLSSPQNATISDGSGQVTILDNDGGSTPSVAINSVTVGEGGGTATLLVTLTNGGSDPVTVNWTTENGTATSGQDYQAGNGTLTFAAGVPSLGISVSINDDSSDENTETFTVRLTNAQGATITNALGRVTITDNDGNDDDDETSVNPPSAPRSLSADPGNAQVTLSWSAPTSTGGGTISGYQYRYAAGTLDFPENWTPVGGGSGATQVIVGQLANGTTYRFQVQAVNEAGGGTPATTTATPVNPTADPSLAVPDLTVGEGDGNAVLRVTLAPTSNQTVTVQYATSDGSATEGDDYTERTGTLTFTANQSAQEISVPITNDGDDEGDETFTLTLTNAQGADIGRATGTVTIQDNDGEGTTIINAPSVPQNLVAEEGDGEVTLLWSPPASNGGSEIVRYEFRYAEGSDPLPDDWTAVSGGDAAREVRITGLSNGEPHRFHVRAVNEAGGGDAAQEAATPQGTGPPLSLSIDDVEVGEGSGTAILRVALSEAADEEVTVSYATSDGSATAGEDYTSEDGTLTFEAGATAQEISISITDDSDEESDETFTVTLSDAQGAGIGDGSGQVTILDNDGTSTTTNPPGAPRGLEADPGNGRVTLSWTAPASDGGAPVTRYEYRYTTGTSAFPDSWTTVPGGADARGVTVSELSSGTRHRFQVRAVNSAGEGAPAEASSTPFDPADGPSLSIDDETVDEDGGNVVLRVTLVPSSDEVVTVSYATDDGIAVAGKDYSAASGTLRFNPGDTSEEIRIPIIDDNEDEASEIFYVRLRGARNASIRVGTAEVTIRDDESTEGAGRPGPPRDFIGVGQHRRVTLTWLPPEDDGGAPISHYEYRFVEGSNRFPAVWTPVDGGARVRRLRLSSLTNGVTYRFQLRAVTGGGRGPAALAEAMPVHRDSTPSLQIRDADVGEGDEEATLTVLLSPPATATFSVSYATSDGNATAGEDYAETTGTLRFSTGDSRQTITVPVLEDEVEEGDETFSVTLSLTGNADARIDQGTGVVTIRDNDGERELAPPGPPAGLFGVGGDSLVTLYWSPPVSDGGSAITHYEYRYAKVGRSFRVRWTGVVGEGRARRLTINGLENGTPYRFQVRAVNQVGPGEPAEARATPGEEGTRPGVTVEPLELEVEEGDSAEYTVVLDAEPFANVTVRMTANLADTDLEVEPTELVFRPTNWDEPQTVLVRSSVDEDREDDLGIVLTHEARGGGYDGFEVPSVTVDILERRERTLPTVGAAAGRGTEGTGAEVIFYVALNSPSNSVVTLKYETADGTATAGEDYEETSGTLAFVPGTVANGISVPLLNDALQEDEETFRVELFDPVNATFEDGVERLVVTGTIVDDDVTAHVSFGEASYEVTEGNAVTVTVELSRDPGGEVRIPIEVAPGEGLGSDEFSVAELVTFNPGQTSADIQFVTSDDHVNEDDEVAVLTLGATLPDGFVAGEPSRTEITIVDDDPLGVRLSPEVLELTEGDSATYAMELTSEPPSGVTVRMTADLSATDLVVDPVEVVFSPADWNVPRTITVRSSVDIDQEDDPGITLTHEASGGGYDGVLVPTVTVDIIDLKMPVIRGEDVVAQEGPGGAISFVVRLSTPSSTVGSVEYATVNGTAVAGEDYAARGGTLHWSPGQSEFFLSVPLLDDFKVEGTETFRLELFNPVNALLAEGADRLVLTGTIEDNDELVVATFGAASYEVPEGGAVTMAVELSGDPGRAIEVPIVVTEGAGAERGDFSVARSVTFNHGERTADLTFRSTADDIDEDDERVTLAFAATLPEGVVAGDPVSTGVTIVDDDQRGVDVSVDALEVEEGTSSTYTVQLTSQPTGTVRVAVTGDPADSDLTIEPASLSFTPRNWRAGQTFTVTAAHDRDAIDEPVITLSHRVSGADYADVEASGVTVTILEDDTPVLSMADVQAMESDGEMVFEAVLDIRSSREIQVDYVSVAGTATEDEDYAGQAGTLVLAPLQTTARLVVPLIDDEVDEPAEHFTLDFADFTNVAPPGDLLSVTGTILDDDLPLLSISAVDQTVPEGTDARFRLARVGDLTVTMSVPVTVVESGDFLAGTLPDAVDFEVGAAEAILALSTVDDPLDESDGTVEVTMAASDDYEIPGSPTARLLVTDNDRTPAVIVAGAEVAESAGEIVLPVTLRGASASEVSVDWMTADLTARAGDDYAAAAGRITFAPGETTGEVRVTVMDDLVPEDPEERSPCPDR